MEIVNYVQKSNRTYLDRCV